MSNSYVLNCFGDRVFSGVWWNQGTRKREVAQLLARKKVTFVSQGKAGTKACPAPPARRMGLCPSITYWQPCDWQLPPSRWL